MARAATVPFVLDPPLVPQGGWRRPGGFEFPTGLVDGARFRDGMEVRDDDDAQTSSAEA